MYAARRVLIRIAFVVCMTAVLVLSLLPNESAASLSTGWDKGNHVLAFAMLGALGLHGWPAQVRRIIAGHVGFGLLIELLQGLTTHRSFDPLDILADLVGLAVGAAAYRAMAARTRPAA